MAAQPQPASSDPATLNAPMDFSSFVGSTLQQANALEQRKEQALAPITQSLVQGYQQQQQLGSAALANLARAQPSLAPPPPPPPNDPLRAFSSAGSLFGLIGAAFTKTPAIAAMKSAASAINARHAGDMEQYQLAYRDWQTKTNLALQRYDQEAKEFSAALDLMKTNMAAGAAAMKAVGAKYGDQAALLFGEANLVGKLADVQTARSRVAASMELGKLRIEAMHDYEEQTLKLRAADLAYRKEQDKTAAAALKKQTQAQFVQGAKDFYDKQVEIYTGEQKNAASSPSISPQMQQQLNQQEQRVKLAGQAYLAATKGDAATYFRLAGQVVGLPSPTSAAPSPAGGANVVPIRPGQSAGGVAPASTQQQPAAGGKTGPQPPHAVIVPSDGTHPAVNQASVDYLRAHPESWEQFKQHFGLIESQKVLDMLEKGVASP